MKISVTEAGKRFNRDWIFRGLTLEFKAGTHYAITGHNGSGKSTLLNIINGNYKPFNGSVKFNGLDIYDPKSNVKQYFGYVPQDDLLIEDLTVFQNLYLSALLSDIRKIML
jgi:ABC-type multidrug transport system ATPase subunit